MIDKYDLDVKAQEYADFYTTATLMNEGWHCAPSSGLEDFSETMQTCYDATITNDKYTYIVEIKSRRDDISPTSFPDMQINDEKIQQLQQAKNDMHASGIIVVELFPSYGEAYIWTLTDTATLQTTTQVSSTHTTRQYSKKEKKMRILPHSLAKKKHFDRSLFANYKQKALELLRALFE